jgi:OmpA-OmpF porin, OOP family
MKSINVIKNLLLTTCAVLAVSACSHTPVTQEFPETASPREEVSKLEADIQIALGAQTDVLAPQNFKHARESLDDAKKSLDKQRDAKETLSEVALGRAYLRQANEFSKISRDNLEDVVVARQQAITAGAREMRAKEFSEVDEELVDVTLDIEKNDLGHAAKKRSSLQLTYLDLELQAIKQSRIGQARDTINLAIKEGAKKFAPRTLAIAEKSFTDTEAFITGHRHDDVQIIQRSTETMKRASHLLKITHDSKLGKKVSSEDTALQIESEQNSVVLKQAELSDKQGQLNNKQSQLDDKVDELAKSRHQINKVESSNAVLALENSSLESQKAFNQSFDDARREFTPDEAEVYKQGNKLMIRLKGLEFPVSQAVLKSSNFPLLAKVQKVIRTFERSSVVVEGHTDSNGGKALNQKLSSERAEAVKDYLSTNNSDQLTNITSVGYGYQKPLATNKTAAGRAQNRRVDISIEPAPRDISSTN